MDYGGFSAVSDLRLVGLFRALFIVFIAVWYFKSRRQRRGQSLPASTPPDPFDDDPSYAGKNPFDDPWCFESRRQRYRVKREVKDQASHRQQNNPFTSPGVQPSRGSPSSTGGQQASSKRASTPPNPFDVDPSSAGKNPFDEDPSSRGKNPFEDDLNAEDDKNNPFFN